MYSSNSSVPSLRYARSRSGRRIDSRFINLCAVRMCCMAILLPMPREPECRNAQTPSDSSKVISMKWLPEPREPSWSLQSALPESFL